jgi:hypothetical protein
MQLGKPLFTNCIGMAVVLHYASRDCTAALTFVCLILVLDTIKAGGNLHTGVAKTRSVIYRYTLCSFAVDQHSLVL